MKKKIVVCLLLLAGTACAIDLSNIQVNSHAFSSFEVESAYINSESSQLVTDDRLIVKTNDMAALKKDFPGLIGQTIDSLQTALLTLRESERSADIMKQLSQKSYVLHAEPDFVADNLAEDKSSLKIAQIKPLDHYAWQHLNLPEAWEMTKGRPEVIVAILDSGLDTTHDVFRDRSVPGKNFVNDTNNTQDEVGHGTHVAGIIASVAPDVKIMPIKIAGTARGNFGHAIAGGIIWATDHGAKVINLSVTSGTANNELLSAINYALDKNVVLVAAMGNKGKNQAVIPAACSHWGVVAVGASDQTQRVWEASNWGNWMTVSAPGVEILSAVPLTQSSGGYKTMTGTSQATPFVSGIAALLLSYKPDLGPRQVKKILESTAEDLGKAGFDTNYGYGLVNASRALRATNGAIPTVEPDTRIQAIAVTPFYVTRDTTVHITVNVNNPDGRELGYGWTVTGGRIEGKGATVVWHVPPEAGKYQIVAGVNDGKKKSYGMTNIRVY